VSWDGETFNADVAGVQANLTQDLGGTFSRNCTVQLFSDHCTLRREDFLFPNNSAATVDTVAGDRQFNAVDFSIGIGVTDDYFTFGLLSWVGGENDGRFSTVLFYDSSGDSFALAERPTFGITVGDRFYVSPGCQKTSLSCRDKFSNIRNFQGNMFVRGSSGAIDAPSSS